MQRSIIFIYGLIAYALFFFTICYSIGFVTSLVVPKNINTGETGGVVTAIAINCSMLLLFAVQHLIMARPEFKRWWTTIIPRAAERSTFVLIASSILLATFWLWRPLPHELWSVDVSWLRWSLTGITIFGFGIVFYSSFLIDHFDLFGLRQVTLNLAGKGYTQSPFMERSLYRLVRHPLMLGFLIAFWITPTMTVGHLLFAAVTTTYIIFGTMIEERDLTRFHGENYMQYKRRVPKLLPWPRPKAALAAVQASAITSAIRSDTDEVDVDQPEFLSQTFSGRV